MAKKKALIFWLFKIKCISLPLIANNNTREPMRKDSFLYRAIDLYYDGFRHMTLGKTLWAIILIKLFIIFAVLKIFFFPDFLKQNAPEGQEDAYVAKELIERSP